MKRLFVLSFIALLAGCHGDDQEKKPVVAVQVQKAKAATVPLTVSGPATIFGKSEARISSRITAPVKTLFVHKGDTVKKGQLLAVLESADLRAQNADAIANVANARANLQRTQGGSIPTEVSQAKADLDAKLAAYNLAQRVYERRKELLAQGAISGREAQISQSEAIQAKANYDAARVHYEAMQTHVSGADLKIAQSSVAQARARQQLAAANLNFTELRSPMNASVTEQNAFPGDMADPNKPIFTVTDLSSAVARAQIDADQADGIKVGQTCSFQQKTEAEETGHSGKVTVVNQAVDPALHTIEIWCEIPNADHALKAGIFGSVTVDVGQVPNAVILPSSAIEFEEGTHKGKVYTVDAQHVAHVRDVMAVPLDDQRVRVISGVHAGEVVITTGEYGLPDGTSVNPTEVRP